MTLHESAMGCSMSLNMVIDKEGAYDEEEFHFKVNWAIAFREDGGVGVRPHDLCWKRILVLKEHRVSLMDSSVALLNRKDGSFPRDVTGPT